MTNLEIAQAATLLPIDQIADNAGLQPDDYEPLGRYKAKLTYQAMERLAADPKGKLILITAITPTPAGEGKTTTCVGLAQGLQKIGRSAIPAIREPAMGPIFGVKGGACGGGYSQVLPMEEINLSFTGDFPAITAAHNLLSAMLDASVYHGNPLNIDVRSLWWPRAVDMNDRALREIVIGLGGKTNGYPRQDRVVITPASEVMAALCLSNTIAELRERLGRIIVALTPDNKAVTAADLKAHGAMAAILRDAIRPNLVQTIEHGPALVHGGPFANIAHGCSSVIATRCGLALADYLITEAGFAADLGAEKFMNIVSRSLGRGPDAVVLVCTVRALKHHGQGDDLTAIKSGMDNLLRHASHLQRYGRPVIVAVNRFPSDTEGELTAIRSVAAESGLSVVVADPWNQGGEGCVDLAEAVAKAADEPGEFQHLYSLEDDEATKLDSIARLAYGAEGVELTPTARRSIRWAVDNGYPNRPICVAKTQYSFSDDPKKLNAPMGFRITVRDVKLAAGAGFLIALAGDIMLMPGLGATPSAQKIDVDERGTITGLF
ncbi:MAG: formate--tetrahydrofolate ligase [Armatimonadetes bacterium]|nr:formate--tetrahydrofolate ligase [Armatimonadota bacterium]